MVDPLNRFNVSFVMSVSVIAKLVNVQVQKMR